VLAAILCNVRVDRHATHWVLDVLLGLVVFTMVGLLAMEACLVCHRDDPSLSTRTLQGYLLDIYTPAGYPSIMSKQTKATCLKRLSRIEGQVRGLARMVEEERYCIDIVTQISAVRAALRRVEEEVLRDHIASCVEHAIVSGDVAEQRRKITELIDVLRRTAR
jgi:CsoR family transcriptional regulator, copper-sensing transcriptional repressor